MAACSYVYAGCRQSLTTFSAAMAAQKGDAVGVLVSLLVGAEPTTSEGGGGFIKTGDVRFTKSSISRTLSTGEDINDVIGELAAPGGDALAKSFTPIRIFEKDGLLFSLDNRRLAIFSAAGRDVPFVWATAREIAAEAWKFTATVEQRLGWFIRVK